MKLKITSPVFISVLGGVIFSMVFAIAYARINPDYFQYRDDGVITMSVGKNIIDYGFIGVSPSGPIVEASSSPLQTFIYTCVYGLTSIDYVTYSWLQTLISTFLVGFIFTRFFNERPYFGLLLSSLSAVSFTFVYPFFLWHASGMENSLTHMMFLLSVYILYKAVIDSQIKFSMALPIFLATIVRIDSIVYIFSILFVFAIYWFVSKKDYKGVIFSLLVLFYWFVFQLWRYCYFGDFLPNTAYAQGISVGDRLRSIFSLDFNYITESYYHSKNLFNKQCSWLILCFFPLIVFVKRTSSTMFLLILIATLFISLSLSPFLFGVARIDITRTTTQITLFVFLFFSALIYFSSSLKKSFLAVLFILPIILFTYKNLDIKPYYLGWSTKDFDTIRRTFEKIAVEQEISRPTISNPDLGVMTYHKEFNVIDLGMLGTPEMAKLRNGPEIANYFFNFALPDMVEAHEFWIKRYCDSIFLDTRFTELYDFYGDANNMSEVCGNDMPGRFYWIRKDVKKTSSSRERYFLNQLQANLNVEEVGAEIEYCKKNLNSCLYISRTVFKFIPELRAQGNFDQVFSLFNSENERALLDGWRNGQSHRAILRMVKG